MRTDTKIQAVTIVSGVVLVACGIFVARPNLHGAKFVRGECYLYEISRIGTRTCECSTDKDDSCTSWYPCVFAFGSFSPYIGNTTETNLFDPVYGTFHKDFSALRNKCLIDPYCDKNGYRNEAKVEDYSNMISRTYLGRRFDCWGYGEDFYFDHSYSNLKAYLALFIPGVVFIISCIAGAILLKDSYYRIPFLPFIWIFGSLCEHRSSERSSNNRDRDREISLGGSLSAGSRSSVNNPRPLPSSRGATVPPQSATVPPLSVTVPPQSATVPPQSAMEMEQTSSYPSSAPPAYNHNYPTSGYQGYQPPPPSSDYPTNNVTDAPPPSYDTVVNDNLYIVD